MMKRKNPFTPRFAALFMLLAVAGITQAACGTIKSTHGQVLTPQRLQALQPGTTTQTQVRHILGSPSTTSTFEGTRRWYYLTETTETTPLNPNVLTGRKVYILDFNKDLTLAKITEKDQTSGKEVPFNPDTTPTQGQSMGIVDQLMDNLGQGF